MLNIHYRTHLYFKFSRTGRCNITFKGIIETEMIEIYHHLIIFPLGDFIVNIFNVKWQQQLALQGTRLRNFGE